MKRGAWSKENGKVRKCEDERVRRLDILQMRLSTINFVSAI
jgi:hypothetical protein